MTTTPEQAIESMIANMREKTGKTLEQWMKIAAAAKLAKHGEIVSHLKSEQGLTHGYANLVAQRTLRGAAEAPEGDDLVAAQYAGTKTGLRPIYDMILAATKKFGSDVEVSPKKGYVSLRRSKQFALIQASTSTRVDVGIQLKGVKAAGRLEQSGSFNAMVTHRVRIESKEQVDKELLGWLKRAYDAA